MNIEFFRGKKIFITGHNGFKGSWLCKLLVNVGAIVRGYSLANENSLFSLFKLDDCVDSIYGDIRDYDKLKTSILEFQPEIIIHMAAQAIVSNAENHPDEAIDINVNGIKNLLDIICNLDYVKSFVNVSTDTVYFCKNKKVYYETDLIGGYNVYSKSKSAAERLVIEYKKKYNRKFYSSTRCVNVIGGGDVNYSRIIPECLNALNNGRNININTPENRRPFVHVLEALYGYLSVAYGQYMEKVSKDAYNFGPYENDYVYMGDVAELFCLKNDNVISWNKKIFDKNKTLEKYICIDLVKKETGWVPVYNFSERLDLVLEWNKVFISKKNIIKITDEQIRKFLERVK